MSRAKLYALALNYPAPDEEMLEAMRAYMQKVIDTKQAPSVLFVPPYVAEEIRWVSLTGEGPEAQGG